MELKAVTNMVCLGRYRRSVLYRHSGLDPESSYKTVSNRSCQSGLFFSINSIFHFLFHSLILFSLSIAEIILSWISYPFYPTPNA